MCTTYASCQFGGNEESANKSWVITGICIPDNIGKVGAETSVKWAVNNEAENCKKV